MERVQKEVEHGGSASVSSLHASRKFKSRGLSSVRASAAKFLPCQHEARTNRMAA
jgi:hypothetical protein